MTQVSQQLKSAIGKQMTSAMANNYDAHGDVDSVANFMMSSNQLKKEVQEDGEQGWSPQIGKTDGLTPEILTKILTKIAKDVEEEEMSKEETKEAMGAASAGGYVAPLFGKPQKRKIKEREERIEGGLADGMSLEDLAKHHDTDVQNIIEKMEEGVNVEMEHTSDMLVAFEIAMDHIYEDLDYYNKLEKIESKEATTSSSVGVYDAPIGGGRKDPLQIDTPKSVYSKLRSVKDPNFPKYGGKGGKYVKIKDKCKKFPYCNQGDIKALEFFENNLVKEAIKQVSKKYKLDETFIKSIIKDNLRK
jgi:Mor family transcriptional regulator